MTQNLTFTPVPVQPRHDGWTPVRQHEFIMRLADTGSVNVACQRVGMSVQAAYRLRRHPEAADFREAWDSALAQASAQLQQVALERALNGDIEIIERDGQVVETRRKSCSDRLLIYMLERQDRAVRRRADEAMVPPRAWEPDPRRLDTTELAGLAATAEGFPDRPGMEGAELDVFEIARLHDVPRTHLANWDV